MNYARVIVGESYSISGYKLKPLQLGHISLLNAVGCDPVTTIAELAMALVVCESDWDKGYQRITGRLSRYRVRLASRRIRLDGLSSRLRHWDDYIKLNTDLPQVASDGDGKSDSGTPFIQHVRTTLISKCNYNPATVLRTPYLQALWDFISYWETQGSCDVYDPAFHDEMREMQRKFDEGLKAKRGNPNGRT